MKKFYQTEGFKIVCILGIAILLLLFVAPGMQESPYNQF